MSIRNLIIGIFEVFYSALGKISQGTKFDLQSFKEHTRAFNISSNLRFRYSEIVFWKDCLDVGCTIRPPMLM